MTELDREPPPRPRDTTRRELGFRIRKPVAWLSPPLLAGTAIHLLGAYFFGAYLDKRELQAALPGPFFDHSRDVDGAGDFWLDFTADSGDGFDGTYTVASLLARPELEVGDVDGDDVIALPRGRILVLGGDEVYPGPSPAGYADRFCGPYRAAMPARPANPPAMYALPGNHDWYDGLTAFLRIFAVDGWIGGWRLEQTRSYFALQLPAGWWLFAVDMQLSAYIDEPQLTYFTAAANEVRPGDRIILVSSQPGWVFNTTKSPNSYDPIDFFLRRIIEPTGAECPIILTGDLHHYARYQRRTGPRTEPPTGSDEPSPPPAEPDEPDEPDEPVSQSDGSGEPPPQPAEPDQPLPDTPAPITTTGPTTPDAATPRPIHLIGAGGGGAFLSDTAHLPSRTFAPSPNSMRRHSSPPSEYDLAARYPDEARARRLAWGILGRLLTHNPGFAVMLGIVHTALMLAFDAAGDRLLTAATVVLGGVVLLSTIAWARTGGLRGKLIGAAHGLAHIGLAVAGAVAWSALPFDDLGSPWSPLLAVALYLPASAIAGTELVAVYLLISGRFGINLTELFAAQSIEDHKCFLRVRLAADGSATIYPIAIDRAGRDWRVAPGEPPSAPWLLPAEEPNGHLIEPPIRIAARYTNDHNE